MVITTQIQHKQRKKLSSTIFDKTDLERVLSKNGSISLIFAKWIAESLEASKAKLRDFVAFGSEGAVASIFIRLTNMYGIVTPEGIRITEPVVLQDVDRHIGVSRETVSRIVNKWKEKGIVESNNKYYLIKQIDYFRQLLMCENCAVENCMI